MRVTPRPIVVTALGGRSEAGSKPLNPGLGVRNLASFDSTSSLRGLRNRFGITRGAAPGRFSMRVAGKLNNRNYVVRKIRGIWTVVDISPPIGSSRFPNGL